MIGKVFSKHHAEPGARPGTLVIPKSSPPPRVRVIRFNRNDMQDTCLLSAQPDDLKSALDDNFVTWIDVQGFGDKSVLCGFGTTFGLHPLLLEDVVNVPQRPKAEAYGEQLLVVVRMVHPFESGTVTLEQVSVIIGKSYVLTFQERYDDVFDPVRKRINDASSMIRSRGPDFLAYALIDTIIDGYYPVLEEIGDHLEELESKVVEDPSTQLLGQLNQFKNQLVNMRRGIWPQREAVGQLARGDEGAISSEVRLHLRDTYDHCVQVTEVTEMYREMVTGLISVYLSSVANRTNEVMKILTITATIFIPLTFLAGIYGMNFEHMPELHNKWAYPAIWCVMFVIGGAMLAFFYRHGWIGRRSQ